MRPKRGRTWFGLTARGVAVLGVVTSCKGAPARIVVGNSDTMVVNNERPVRLPVRVVDAGGREVPATNVRYQRTLGTPLVVSDTGMVTCIQRGDGTLRVSVGGLVQDVVIRCRPVHDVRAELVLDLIAGGRAQDLALQVLGTDGRPVNLIAAKLTIEDSNVVAHEGFRLRGRAAGGTGVTVRVGDRESFTMVHVYERKDSPEEIGPGERVAVPVRLTAGGMRRWRLAAAPELYFVSVLSDGDTPPPGLAIVGANCAPFGPRRYYCYAMEDASVYVYHPRHVDSTQELCGTLAIWRQDVPLEPSPPRPVVTRRGR